MDRGKGVNLASDHLPRVATERILATLQATYPEARSSLVYRNSFELLVATMLSAQSTDAQVNRITPKLFAVCPSPERMVATPLSEIEQLVSGCGLFRTKATNLQATARLLIERHGGQVPDRMEDLLALPGVGRKTANVVLSNGFGIPAIAVDTHVFRVANRIGLCRASTPETAEEQLRRRIPRRLWSSAHHWLIWHGRLVCLARTPRCASCPLLPYCRYGKATRRYPTQGTYAR